MLSPDPCTISYNSPHTLLGLGNPKKYKNGTPKNGTQGVSSTELATKLTKFIGKNSVKLKKTKQLAFLTFCFLSLIICTIL